MLARVGHWNLLVLCNILQLLLSASLKQVPITAVIMAGRFVSGLLVGHQNICFAKALNDTVPAEVLNSYAVLMSSSFNAGLLLSNIVGIVVPLNNGQPGDVERMINDENWRVVFAFPAVM